MLLTNWFKSFQNTQVVKKGWSDFHKMKITVLKMFYTKQKHNTVFYRNYTTFHSKKFKAKLKFYINNIDFQTFHNILLSVLNENVFLKQKQHKANNAGFIAKDIRKPIMKLKTESSRIAYNKQRNLCTSLLKSILLSKSRQ